jgi:hypothetical protein
MYWYLLLPIKAKQTLKKKKNQNNKNKNLMVVLHLVYLSFWETHLIKQVFFWEITSFSLKTYSVENTPRKR